LSKRTAHTKQPVQDLPERAASRLWKPWQKWVVSVLVAAHLFVVFWSPLAFNSRPSPEEASPLVMTLMGIVEPYADFFYLNQGYAFFAPDPGPSHLIQYTVDKGASTETPIVERRFPGLHRQFPRLYYHRHFMLAEWWNAGFEPPPVAETPQQFVRRRELYELLKESYARHLAHELGVDSVTVERLRHRQPSPYEFLDNEIRMGIDDERLFEVLSDDLPPQLENLPNESANPERRQDSPLLLPPLGPVIPYDVPREVVPTPGTLPESVPTPESVPLPSAESDS
jgi:hypothetical protein